jgi:hemerythrin superfamily protein
MSTTQILPTPPTAMLKAVHEEVKQLFARYDALGLNESRAKKEISQKIQELLEIHLEIEEVLFYPAIESIKADLAISIVLKALQAHRQVRALLVELRTLSSGNESLDAKMEDLEHCVLSHLHAEETEIFPHARILPPETLQELGTEMEKLRDRLRMKRGSPERPPETQNPF